MKESIKNRLIKEAIDIANNNFCCPYSNFTVGAALLTEDGKIYKGFNIENDGIQSICAERVAFTKALSEGNKKFQAVAVVGKDLNEKYYKNTLPCGYCRQFIREYTTDGFTIISYDEETKTSKTYRIEELLPESFRKE